MIRFLSAAALVVAGLTAQASLAEPNSGFLVRGDVKHISWLAPPGPGSWDLTYSTDGPAGPWLPIALGLPAGTRSYAWTVPVDATLTVQARVRVVRGADEAVSANDLRVVVPGAVNVPFGQGCGLATLNPVWNWAPVTGGVMHTQVTRLQPTTVAVFMMLALFELPTPQDLGSFGMPGCDLYMAVEHYEVVPFRGSLANFFLPIPNAPALIGCQLLQQALVLDSAVANARRGVVTNPMRGLVYDW